MRVAEFQLIIYKNNDILHYPLIRTFKKFNNWNAVEEYLKRHTPRSSRCSLRIDCLAATSCLRVSLNGLSIDGLSVEIPVWGIGHV